MSEPGDNDDEFLNMTFSRIYDIAPMMFTTVRPLDDFIFMSINAEGENVELARFKPDGTLVLSAPPDEAAKVFWDFVEQYMAEAYRRYALEAVQQEEDLRRGLDPRK